MIEREGTSSEFGDIPSIKKKANWIKIKRYLKSCKIRVSNICKLKSKFFIPNSYKGILASKFLVCLFDLMRENLLEFLYSSHVK